MLKKILITISILIILLIAFLVAAPFIFKDKLVSIAKTEINKQLNAKVDFKDVGITLFHDFPDLTFSLKELSVVNNEPFNGDTLASIGSFSTTIDILGLIKDGKVDIKGIGIDRPSVNVLVLKDGTANYDILKAAPEAKKTESAPTQFEMKLKSFTISEGDIRYADKQSDMAAMLAGLNFKGKGDFTQDIFTFQSNTVVDKTTITSGAVNYLSNTNIELKLDLGMDLPNSKYTFKESSLRLNALVLGVDGWLRDKKEDTYEMDLKFSAKETSFKNLLSLIPAIYLKDFEKVKTAGNIALSGFAKGTYQGESYPTFGLTVKVDNAMFQYPDLPTAVSDINIDLKADNPGGDLDLTIIDIPKFNMKIGSEPFAFKLHVKNPVSDPDIDLNANGKLDLGNVKQFYPMESGDELAGKVDANLSMKGRLSALENEQYEKVQANGTIDITGLKYKSKDLPEGVSADKIAMVFSSKTGSTSSATSGLPVKGYGTFDIQNLKYADKTLPGGKADISSLYLSLNENDAQLERLKVKIGSSDFNLTGKLDNLFGYLLSDGKLIGNLTLKSGLIDANEWMAASTTTETSSSSESTTTASSPMPANLSLDLSTNIERIIYDTMEIRNVRARASIKDDVSAFQLESLDAKVGKSDFSVTGNLDNLVAYLMTDGMLSGNINVSSNLIDLNELMANGSTSSTEAASSTEANAESTVVPANLALGLSASSSKVIYDKVEMKNVIVKAKIMDQTFTLQSLTADMLSGSAAMSGAFSTKEPTSKVDFNYDIRNIDIRQAVNSMSTTEKLAPVFKYMNGKFSAKGDMNGTLLSDLSFDMGSLLANGRVDINNGVVSGFPVLVQLADKFKINELKNVNISDTWTIFEVKDGRIAVEPFDVKLNKMAMNVAGSQGIDQTVDYNILMDVPKNLMGGSNDLVKGLLSKNPIPGFSAANLPELTKFKVKVTNTLTDPKLAVSLLGGGGATVKEQVVEEVKEKVEEVKKEVSAEAKAQADKIMAEANQQAQKIRDEARKLSDTVKKEGYAAAKKLEDDAKNPIAKVAAQKAAKKLRQETDDKANKIVKEADSRSNQLVQEAQKKADQLLKIGQ